MTNGEIPYFFGHLYFGVIYPRLHEVRYIEALTIAELKYNYGLDSIKFLVCLSPLS